MSDSGAFETKAIKGVSRDLLLKLKQAEAAASIECLGVDLIKNEAQVLLALALLNAYGSESEGFLYFEPCTIRATTRPPDALLCTRSTGIVIIECKGYAIGDVQGTKAGSLLVKKRGRIAQDNPFAQVQDAMFAIKGPVDKALGRQFDGPLFTYLITLPRISSEEWKGKGYNNSFPSDELLLGDELKERSLRAKIDSLVSNGLRQSHRSKPLDVSHVRAIKTIFGDSDLINSPGNLRLDLENGSLGLMIAEHDSSDKLLSEEQKALCELKVGTFPRVIRGVAGSGKTVVLAIQAARFVATDSDEGELFEADKRSIAVVCFNRSLVSMLRKQVERAYRQRTLDDLPSTIHVNYMNGLMYRLIKNYGWPLEYIRVPGTTSIERAEGYISQIKTFAAASPEHYQSILLDAIFVDEGQDLEVEEFELLLALLKPHPETNEKCIVIFYDDAQNLYAKKRPVWRDLGIDVQRGDRSRIMKECFRNTREIVELAFNVLLGTASIDRSKVQTRTYSNIAELLQAGLVEEVGSHYAVNFAERTFDPPVVKMFPSRHEERAWISNEVLRLIKQESVRPSDILILCGAHYECDAIQLALRSHNIAGVKGFRRPDKENEKDQFIFTEDFITITTVNAAKGYDAQIVFMVGTEEFSTEPEGRASFYVGATRAKLLLYVTGCEGTGTLLHEAEKLTSRPA